MSSLKSCIASVATATVGFAVAADNSVDVDIDVADTAGLETEPPPPAKALRKERLLNTISTVVICADKLAA